MFGLGCVIAALPAGLHADPAVPDADNAPIALLVDISSGQVLHSREADRRFLPASVTKVMTAYLAFEMLADGRLKPDQKFTVSEKIFKDWSGTGSSMFLQRGEQVSVDRLLQGITTVSANDGSAMLAEGAAGSMAAWVVQMNKAASALGMDDSHFGTPNGWPDEGATFTSARDLATLARAMIERHPALYARYFGKTTFSHNGYTQRNHDPLTGVVKGADGIKTGYTREAGYNFLGTAVRDGRRLVLVVAGTDGDLERARIAREYVEWGFTAFDQRQMIPAGATVGRAQVQGGSSRELELKTARPVIVDMPSAETRKVAMSLHYRGPLQAPIAKGSPIAELEVRIEGFEPYRIPLIAARSVSTANPFQRLINGVLGFLT